MSTQRGNVSRSRGQKHQNTTAYRNDKYGATAHIKKAKTKVHDGLCQRCKDVLEWKVKYNKYKPMTQPRKCVKCSQKTVKDAYHVICKPCSIQLELCVKCGKKEDIVIPINSQAEDENQAEAEAEDENQPEADCQRKKKGCERKTKDLDGLDNSDDDFGSDDDINGDFRLKTTTMAPDISIKPYKCCRRHQAQRTRPTPPSPETYGRASTRLQYSSLPRPPGNYHSPTCKVFKLV